MSVYTCMCITTLYVLLKALLPVCMKYTALGESLVTNIALCFAQPILYLSRGLSQRAVYFHTNEVHGSALLILLYFTL